MENAHHQIVRLYEAYLFENKRFTENHIKSAAPKARKALQLLSKAIKERRVEIMTEKKAMDEHKQK